MTTYHIDPQKQTLHGSFSKHLKPIVTVNSGDSVLYSTLDALWELEPFPSTGYRKIFEIKG